MLLSVAVASLQPLPLTPRCAQFLDRREHALIGVSALNGYFTPRTIRHLLDWATRTFSRVHVLVPGVELAGTLVARGCPAAKAGAKARAAANNTRNRVIRALDSLDPPDATVVDWNELASVPAYDGVRRRLERLFATDPVFREHCMDAVRPIVGVPQLSREQAENALPFLLAELPFLIDTPSILGTGSSVFCYPRPMPMVDLLYAGLLPVRPAPAQGFVSTALTQAARPAHHLSNAV
ncbi:tRNA-dependent cyclodipeptide synthase [Nonomuraea jabiensis]|uniref:Cyclodipeptide synthase n=1 Tax=Nonomuraea jabiensis TaxID=882448 RepID=A0A7W9GKE8_9ACTN|nr:tRNA-dependent cyclodipeptide synthase [Nonomuraea jabiensis]MBB5785311.1 cyclo(L-tyrosyl-L-tyrosyl) synthase [Nonomuraea jabiensis]